MNTAVFVPAGEFFMRTSQSLLGVCEEGRWLCSALWAWDFFGG